MPRFRYIARLLCALLVGAGLFACSGEDCPINNVVQGKLAFYNQHGESVSYADSLTVRVVRPQGDSVVLNRKVYASEVLFPLSYVHGTDTLIFDYSGGRVPDSLFISHTNRPTLVSVDCGTAMFHTITSVGSTHHYIDTLVIKSSDVNYDERENIQVIYR
ncbi:MAG: hypothetical protein IJC77_03880 [Bacteroidaceae bacterium]|nr:hypothetical protein [Bacteroidaceae bacterium]